MAREKRQYPTEKELAILKVLWSNGPSTVRQVYAEISKTQKIGYTTTLKLMQIMIEKGLVVRDESQWSHVYEAAVPAEQTQRQLVRDLLDRAFRGSAQQLVVQALAAKRASREELAEIRRLIEDLEKVRSKQR